MIQQNASASEEMASTTEELTGQSEQLVGALAFFKTGDEEAVAARRGTAVKPAPRLGSRRKGRPSQAATLRGAKRLPSPA